MRFKYKIIHVPGKQLVAADALSRAPLGPENNTERNTLERECQVYIDYVIEHIPATKTKLDQIKDMQNRDGTTRQLRAYTDKGWPVHRTAVPENLLQYWPYRTDIRVS